MKHFQMPEKVRNAVMLGVMCAIAYLAVYLARNILSAVLIAMALVCFTVFHQIVRHGIIRHGQYRKPKGNGGGVKVLIKHRIIKFIFISIITGVVRTAVVFWPPTYLSQHLGFASDTAALLL